MRRLGPVGAPAVEESQDKELTALCSKIRHELKVAPDARHALERSCLQAWLVKELQTSFTSMADRSDFYKEILELVEEHPWIPGLKASLSSLLEATQRFLVSMGALNKPALERDKTQDKAGRTNQSKPGAPIREQSAAATDAAVGFAELVKRTASAALAHTTDEAMPAAEQDAYVTALKELQFNVEALEGQPHRFLKEAEQEKAAPQARTLRLAKEIAGLCDLLPLSRGGGIFVRVDEAMQQLWRALVTGPEDTPYAHGCFIFDIYFPPEYPTVAPQVRMLTTGDGTFGFNPNLYPDGTVCLSLLGTWSGEQGENWDPRTSKTIQVLISIQSLIMVPQPFFNEPGYEQGIGNAADERKAREYNRPVRENCLRLAMSDHLAGLQSGIHRFKNFEAILERHFFHQQKACLKTVDEWVAEATAAPGEDLVAALEAHREKLLALRQKLVVQFGMLKVG